VEVLKLLIVILYPRRHTCTVVTFKSKPSGRDFVCFSKGYSLKVLILPKNIPQHCPRIFKENKDHLYYRQMKYCNLIGQWLDSDGLKLDQFTACLQLLQESASSWSTQCTHKEVNDVIGSDSSVSFSSALNLDFNH